MNDVFLRALRGEPTPYTPVWFMRQAGRYQAAYRKIRETHTLPEIVRDPELTARVTRLPVEALGVDAAILFADITTPLYGMGVRLEIVEGRGPVIEAPIQSPNDVERLLPFDPKAHVPFVLAAIRHLKEELEVPLIGFAGAPFTLASYLVEGGPSKNFARVKRFMLTAPEAWHRLMEKLTLAMTAYLKAQATAGADALMVFDSWIGRLTRRQYQTYVLPHQKRLFAELKETGRPTIHFGTGTMHLLELLKEAGGDAIGVDTTTPLAWARERLGNSPVQGNLDPAVLLADQATIAAEIEAVLAENAGRPGHVFNLGHGMLPMTPEQNAAYAVETVHRLTGR